MPLSRFAPRSSFLPPPAHAPIGRPQTHEPSTSSGHQRYPSFNPFLSPFTASLINHCSLHFFCNAYGSGHPTCSTLGPSFALALTQVQRNHAQPRLVLFSSISSPYQHSSSLLQRIIQNGSRQAWKRREFSTAHVMDTYPDTLLH